MARRARRPGGVLVTRLDERVTSPPCERCGQPVGGERLAALPRATTCIACASLRKRPSRGQTCS
ncbi:TraR/DksA family transcriptional regulator [Nocardioides marinisabuli]|uniref:TraR/DksA family transcriptional regulator n=1 Tax=Nocardioides marinisabuli TaxID=419476 RepID=UPI003D2F5D81